MFNVKFFIWTIYKNVIRKPVSVGGARQRTEQEAEMVITNTNDRPVVSDSFSSLSALYKHQSKVSTQNSGAIFLSPFLHRLVLS